MNRSLVAALVVVLMRISSLMPALAGAAAVAVIVVLTRLRTVPVTP